MPRKAKQLSEHHLLIIDDIEEMDMQVICNSVVSRKAKTHVAAERCQGCLVDAVLPGVARGVLPSWLLWKKGSSKKDYGVFDGVRRASDTYQLHLWLLIILQHTLDPAAG